MPSGGTPPRSSPAEKPAATARSVSTSGKVDLNTASQAELEALPGIGPVYAKKIIEHRPYANVVDLENAELPAGTQEKIAGLVTAGSEVWLNTDSNIYHKPNSVWYGKTKSGKFVSEQEAIDAGARESEQ
jgi:hypothetical protein